MTAMPWAERIVARAAREMSVFYDMAQEIEECSRLESRHSSSGSAARDFTTQKNPTVAVMPFS